MSAVIFRFCDLALTSNIALPELPQSDRAAPDVLFRISRRQAPVSTVEPFHRWELPGGLLWLSISHKADGYLLQFPGLATFHIAADAATVRCWAPRGTPLVTVRHLFLDQVMPLVLGLMRRAVLHASAVATAVGAIAFSGETGQGKSTLAGSFVARGASLLTDDCLLLNDGFQVVPSYPGLRLWPDVAPELAGASRLRRVCHYSRKGRLRRPLPFSSEPVPLRRLYLLSNPAPEISIVSLSPRDALIELVARSFLVDITDRGTLRLNFETLSRLAALGLVYRLSYPHDLGRLPELHNAVLRHASTG